MLSANQVEKRRQVAGVFVVLGLVIEALCLIWPTPIAFVIFVAIGGLLMFVGIVTLFCIPWSDSQGPSGIIQSVVAMSDWPLIEQNRRVDLANVR